MYTGQKVQAVKKIRPGAAKFGNRRNHKEDQKGHQRLGREVVASLDST